MASQGSKWSQGSQSLSSSQREKYRALLNPVRDPVQNFAIDIPDLLQDFMEVIESNSQDPINESQLEMNFAEAALILQSTTSIYTKKVDHLYLLTIELCQALHSDKETSGSNKAKDKDMSTSRQHNVDEFSLTDDIKYQHNNHLVVDRKSIDNWNMSIMKPILLPLDKTKKEVINIKTILGEVIENLNYSDIIERCMFSATNVLKPENGKVPLFADSTSLSMRVQDIDPMDISNASFRCTDSDEQSQSFSGFSMDPNLLNINTVDIENNNFNANHVNDSPASVISSQEVDNADHIESQEINVHTQRRSERQALKLAAKRDKSEKNCCVFCKNALKTPTKTIKVKFDSHKERSKSSRRFVHNRGMTSKVLKKVPLKANVNAVEYLVSTFHKNEQRVSLFSQRLATRSKKPPEIDIPELSISCPESSHTDGDAPDNNDCSMYPDFDNGACASSGLLPIGLCESALQDHVNNFRKGLQEFSMSTELSRKVKAWKEKIKPVLEEEIKREVFDIYQYGTRIIDKFANNKRKQTLLFSSICKSKSRWEVCRYFLASLMLANNNNVEISPSDTPSGMHEINLTLLSRKRHQEQLDVFGHSLAIKPIFKDLFSPALLEKSLHGKT